MQKYDELRLLEGLDEADYSDDMKWRELKKDGKPLPEDVHEDNNGKFYRFIPSQLSKDDEMLFVQLRQLRCLKAIRNCTVFFVILAVIAILILLRGL